MDRNLLDNLLGFILVAIVVAFVVGGLFVALIVKAFSQEHNHPPQDEALHEKFYSTWNMPIDYDGNGRRTKSCCNKEDCYPTQVKREDGHWYFLQREYQQWVRIPDHIIEQNQLDPRESPDGQAHVCANKSKDGTIVFCFTHGGGV